MDNRKAVQRVLSSSNYSMLELNDFIKAYIEKLVYNIITYVDSKISINNIDKVGNYTLNCELSQEIIGIPGAYSCVDGNDSSLIAFASAYSRIKINEFDILAKEAIADFLNLNNGLFVVYLSENNICELSLNVPRQNGNHEIDSNSYKSIITIPIVFTFGIIKFILCENTL